MRSSKRRNIPKEGITPEEVAGRIKEVAKNIREISTTARDTVKKFHESGAIRAGRGSTGSCYCRKGYSERD